MSNVLTSLPIENVSVTLRISYLNGSDASTNFYVNSSSLQGIADIIGGGSIMPTSTALASWLIIPKSGAGGVSESGIYYNVQAEISYVVNQVSFNLSSSTERICVKPQPFLEIEYYLPQSVSADVPFYLGIRVTNIGNGTAHDFAIESAQPSIYENLSHLAINFTLVSSTVQGEDTLNSLKIAFGDIAPGETKIGYWSMVCSLSGNFTYFNATYVHSNALGGEETSLISVSAYILMKDVVKGDSDLAFMVSQGLAPEKIIDASTGEVGAVTPVTFDIVYQDSSKVTFRTDKYSDQWIFVSVTDPFNNQKSISRIQRWDGQILNPVNYWMENGKIMIVDDPDEAYTVFYDTAFSFVAFDFGTSGSPLEEGCNRVSSSTAYSVSTGYGWSDTSGLGTRDRSSPDNLRCDFVFSSAEHTFNVDLPNGVYIVTALIGDQSFMHDQIDVYAESLLVINDLTAPAGSFREVSFRVTVADGQLNLRIADDGGADSNWVLDALTIVVAPPLPTEASFDFGTSGSPVEAGFTQVPPSTVYSATVGFGWSSTAGLDSRDRSTPDDLRSDFVFGSAEHTFNVDLANGEYLVTVVIGDQSFMHDQIDVYAEGTLVINHATVARGSFLEISFRVTITDEQLNLRILDDGGSDGNWVLDALTIVVAPPLPTEARFDFGTASSPVEAGYTHVTPSTVYAAVAGYGWTTTAGLDSRDRGNPDDLRRDLVFSAAEHTFNVDLANGEYTVTVVVGDQSFMHDNVDIYAEGVLVVNDLTASAGSFQQVNFVVTVTDGQLSLRILDDGGSDPNWVLTGLEMQAI
jgi:fibronectin type 3 domain-containing protein